MTDARTTLEGHVRECFGRVVYTHKTHEKCADILLARQSALKISQIVISALTAGGGIAALTNLFGLRDVGAAVAAVLSTLLLILNAYMKSTDLGQLAQMHRHAAAELWLVREKYQALITCLTMRQQSLESVAAERDALTERLHAIYKNAPATTSAAYKRAQSALKYQEDMTFSDKEIDAFLPRECRRESGHSQEERDTT